jgi:rSAM/selenodomain-associated transferase 2
MKISVIIPVLNEKEILPSTLQSLGTFPELFEIIVVDGGSTDGTREALEGSLLVKARLLSSECGRGNQLNAGAKAAKGDVLIFLHADTRLPPPALQAIEQVLSDPRVVGGGFRVRFQEERPCILRVVEAGINFRTRFFRDPTGDQAIFCRRSAFDAIGGFTPWPIFEDVDFMHRLRGFGRCRIVLFPVITSARRYIARGVLRTAFLMWALRIGYWLGISPFRLHCWYRDVRPHLLRASK